MGLVPQLSVLRGRMGESTGERRPSGGVVGPEVGLLVPLGSGVQGSVNAKYNYAASAGGPSRKHSYFGLNPRIRVDE